MVRDGEAWPGRKRQDWEGRLHDRKFIWPETRRNKRHDAIRDTRQPETGCSFCVLRFPHLQRKINGCLSYWKGFRGLSEGKDHSPHSLDDPLPSSPWCSEAPLLLSPLRTESTNTGFLSALPGPPQTLSSPFFTWPAPDFLEDTAPKSSFTTCRPGISNSVLNHKDFCSNEDFAKFHLMEQKSEPWQVREMSSVSDSAGELLLYSKAQRGRRSGPRLHRAVNDRSRAGSDPRGLSTGSSSACKPRWDANSHTGFTSRWYLSHPFMTSPWRESTFPALQMGKLRVM